MKTKPSDPSSNTEALPPAQVQLLLRRVVELYAQALSESPQHRESLRIRGITNLAHLENLKVGYSAGKLRDVLNDPELFEQLQKLGIFDGRGRERFKDCLVFPQLTPDGVIAGLWVLPLRGGDAIFLPEWPSVVWNAGAAQRSAQLYVCTNPLDALALLEAGLRNVVAVDPNRGQVDTAVLEKHGVQQLFLVLGTGPQNDKVAQALTNTLRPYRPEIITLPDCDGPLAFLKARGAKALAEAVVAGVHGVAAVTLPGMRPRPDGLSLPVRDILYTLIGIDRTKRALRTTIRATRGEKSTAITIDFHQLRQRREFIKEMARVFEGSADQFEGDLSKLQQACDIRLAQPDFVMPAEAIDPVPEGDKREAHLLGESRDLFRRITEDYRALGVVGETENIILSYLVMSSRRMSDPLALMNISNHGAGKSLVAEVTRDLCPPEDRFDATHLSGKALFHAGPGKLEHKLITIAEQEGAEKANYSLRVLISAKALTAVITSKDPVTGRLQAETKRVDGPAAVINTSSDPNLDRETLSRYVVTHSDQSREQTREIQRRQRESHTEAGILARREAERIYRRHHALQRLLSSVEIILPEALEIPYADDRLNGRRDFPKVLTLVKAVAFVRQMQKEVRQVGSVNLIEADADDVAVALPLIRKLFGAGIEEISHSSRSLLVTMHGLQQAAPGGSEAFRFTRRAVRDHTGWSKTSVQRCFAELEESEYILRDTSTRQRPYRYRLDWQPPKSSDGPQKVQIAKATTSDPVTVACA